MNIVRLNSRVNRQGRGILTDVNDWEASRSDDDIIYTPNVQPCVVAAVHDAATNTGALGRFKLASNITNRNVYKSFDTYVTKHTDPATTSVWLSGAVEISGSRSASKAPLDEIIGLYNDQALACRADLQQQLSHVSQSEINTTWLLPNQALGSVALDCANGTVFYNVVNLPALG